MATPQRQLPNDPRRDNPPKLESLPTGRVQREVSSGGRFRFWWVWVLVVVGIWYVGFGWGNSGGWFWGQRPAATATDDMALRGPGVAILTATNKMPYIGQTFNVQNVPVERQVGPRTYWIGSRFNAVPMLVINVSNPPNISDDVPGPTGNNGANTASARQPPPNAAANDAASPNHAAKNEGSSAAIPQTRPHEWLNVIGQIVRAPLAAQAEQQWGLSKADAGQLENQGAYIQATEMHTVAH